MQYFIHKTNGAQMHSPLHHEVMQALFAIILMGVTVFIPLIASAKTPDHDAIRTIALEGQDNMRFSQSTINAKPGEKIRVELTNVSNLPPSVMSHNFILLDQTINPTKFVSACLSHKDNGYIDPSYNNHIIAATDLASKGETVSVTFTVPEKAGEYTYLCSFPGHFISGMRGTLNVNSNPQQNQIGMK